MRVNTRKIKKLIQDRGHFQYWVGERIGYTGPSGRVYWNRIINGSDGARLDPEKVGPLAGLLSVSEGKIKKLFAIK